MDRQKTLAVDLDDVLFDFLGQFFSWHNDRYGTKLQVADMVFARIWDAWGGTKKEAGERISLFWSEIDLLEVEPIVGAVETLTRLKESFRLTVVSARMAGTTAITKAWIDKYFNGIFDEIMLGIADPVQGRKPTTKAEACKKIAASILIDDQLVHARECAEVGIRVLLFGDFPYNQAAQLPVNVVRVPDWAAVGGVLLPETK